MRQWITRAVVWGKLDGLGKVAALGFCAQFLLLRELGHATPQSTAPREVTDNFIAITRIRLSHSNPRRLADASIDSRQSG